MSKYSKEFKEEAIRLSDEIGNKKAAAQLGIPYYTLADWRNKSKHKPKEPELSNTEPSQQKWTQKSCKKRNESQYFFCFRKTVAFIPRFA